MPKRKKVKLKKKKIKVKRPKKVSKPKPSKLMREKLVEEVRKVYEEAPEETEEEPEEAEEELKEIGEEPKVTEEEPEETGEEPKVTEEEPEEIAEEPKEIVKGKKKKKEMVNLDYKALNKVLRHGMRFSNLNIPREKWVECMGFLVGNVDDNKVEIKDAIPMVHGNIVEVEFKNEHYAKADEINQSLTDENWIIGWYHTHPGHGLFLSTVDKINHSGYQSLNSKAIALVFDPSKFHDENKLEEYIKIFRLKNPELREKSDFAEIESVEITHSLHEVIASICEVSMLNSKGFPLVLEYGEDYKKPEIVTKPTAPVEVEDIDKTIKEMRGIVKKMHKEIKILHNRLEGHMESTKKAIEDLRKRDVVNRGKETIKCEFCGYESITLGDTTCPNCGKSFI